MALTTINDGDAAAAARSLINTAFTAIDANTAITAGFSGYTHSSFATASQGALADTALQTSSSIAATQLTGTINNARLPAVISGLTSVSATTFTGALTGTASGNLVAGGALGTPASGTLTNCTGLPIASGVSGLGSGIATFLATPTLANLQAATSGLAVIAGNAFTGGNTVTLTSLGTTPTAGSLLVNSTAATSGNQQVSPSLLLEGQGWKTTATAASQSVRVRNYVLPVQGSTAPTGLLNWDYDINASGTYANFMSLSLGSSPVLNFGYTSSTVAIGTTYNGGTYWNISANAVSTSSGGSSMFRAADQYVTNPGLTAGTDSGTHMIAISTASSGTARTNSNSVGFGRASSGVIRWGLDEATASGTITHRSPNVTTGTGWTHSIQAGTGSTAGGAVTISTAATTTPAVRLTVKASGVINLSNVPSSSSGLSSGDIYQTAGTLMIVP